MNTAGESQAAVPGNEIANHPSKTGALVKEITAASFHRNGISGAGFYAILFVDPDNGPMVASLFDDPGVCAVYKVAELAKGNVAFAMSNSWRGDRYEAELRPMLDDFIKTEGGNRVGPFSMIPPEAFIKAAK